MSSKKHFPTQLTLLISKEMRLDLTTISFQIGNKGMYSNIVRKHIQSAIESYIAGLTPKEKAEYAEIRSNVALMESMGRMYNGSGNSKKTKARPPKFPTIEKKGMKI